MTVLHQLIKQLQEMKVKSLYDSNKPPRYTGDYRIALSHAIDKCNLLLEDEQEMLKEYHQSELLKLNKSDVISSVCDCGYDEKGNTKICSKHLGEIIGIS